MNKVYILLGLVLLMMVPVGFATEFYHNRSLSFQDTTASNVGYGWSFRLNQAQTFVSVITNSSVTATNLYLYNSSATGNATITIVPQTSAGLYYANNITLLANVNYTLILCSPSATYTRTYGTPFPSFPIVANNNSIGFNWTNSVFINSCTSNNILTGGEVYNIIKVNLSTINNTFLLNVLDNYTNEAILDVNATAINASGYIYNVTTNNGVLSNWSNFTLLKNSSSLWNITIDSTYNGGYFSKTLINQNVSLLATTTLAQSAITFYGVEKITGNNISGVNFSTQYLTNVTHYMKAGTYTVNTSKSGYYNQTSSYTATPLSIQTVPIYNISNQSLNLTVRYILNNSLVSGFTVYISNSTYAFNETYTVTGSQITLNLTSNIQYTISVNVTDALGNTTNFTSTLNQSNLTMYVASTTQINLYFFDEQTLLPVNNVNYTVIGETYAFSGSTGVSLNNVNFSALSTDSYEIRYTQNGGNYTSRSYFLNIPLTSASQANISLYMLSVSNSTSFVLTVTDTYNQPIAGLTASLLRRYAINNVTTYYVVEMMRPSVALQGATPFVAVANTIPYIFRVQDSSGNVIFQGAGTSATNLETQYLISTNVYIKVQTETSVLQGANNFFGLSTAFSNTTTAVQLSWSGQATYLSQMCLQMYSNLTTLLTNSCSMSPSGIISYTYNPVNGTMYTAYAYATSTVDGKTYLIGNPFIDDRRASDAVPSPGWGYLGVFLVILLMMFVGIGFADRPSVSILIGGASIFAFFTVNAFGNIIQFASPSVSVLIGSSALMISIIIAYAMREEF